MPGHTPGGHHYLLDFFGCDAKLLMDTKKLKALLLRAAEATGAEVFHTYARRFQNSIGAGVTAVVVIAESHLSLHTWGEYGYAAIDIFTCGHLKPDPAFDILVAGLNPRNYQRRTVIRGRQRCSPG